MDPLHDVGGRQKDHDTVITAHVFSFSEAFCVSSLIEMCSHDILKKQ